MVFEMLDENNALPLYRQLYNILFEKIKSRQWEDEFKIPTEAQLCKQYSVSRMTIRLALEELKSKGYIYRKQGRGTFITKPKIEQELSSFYSFSDKKTDGTIIKNSVLHFTVNKSTKEIADKLQIDKKDKVYTIKRIRMIDDIPFAYEISYVPFELCEGLDRNTVEDKGLYYAIDKVMGEYPNNATESFESILINKECSDFLMVEEKSSALHIERVASIDNTVVEYCSSLVRGDRIKYNVILK